MFLAACTIKKAGNLSYENSIPNYTAAYAKFAGHGSREI
jgi:hypothetical protein